MAEHNDTGAIGENLAVKHLKSNNYQILETNWRYQNAEVDIIAQEKNVLVIVEVKTRKSNVFGEPEEWVNRQKQKNLIKAANAFIEQRNLDLEVRFDIVSVIYGRSGHQINHIQDAFYPIR